MNNTFKANNIFGILLFTLAISLTESCGGPSFGQRADSLFLVTDQSQIFYDLKKPEEKHFLPYVLAEISGLSHTGTTILAVDDETGKIFEYDLAKRDIVHSIEFGKPGDYEGIELVGRQVFVLESDGDIYVFDYTAQKTTRGEKFENKLSRENDTEGLGFDPKSQKLMIVCKEKGEVDGNDAKGRAVYGYDLDEQKLDKKPMFEIRSKDLKKFWEERKSFDYDQERIKFKPSAIAYHPIEETFYILASVGKLLVVVERDGTIRSTYPISPRILSQPEGICFAPNGDMYLSSEGEGDRGYIVKFSMQKR